MSTRTIKFVEGEYYHVYNRGNSKQKIFHSKYDYLRFLEILYFANSTEPFNTYNLHRTEVATLVDEKHKLVAIGAYCLMPNHFHILLTPVVEDGISKFMQKLATAYAMYYNEKYERTGSLFEGKFKAEHIGTDRYLKYIFSYIHLNPVKLIDPKWKEEGIKNKKEVIKYLNDYEYSSYQNFLDSKVSKFEVVNRKPFPNYFPTEASFQKEIMEWIMYKE